MDRALHPSQGIGGTLLCSFSYHAVSCILCHFCHLLTRCLLEIEAHFQYKRIWLLQVFVSFSESDSVYPPYKIENNSKQMFEIAQVNVNRLVVDEWMSDSSFTTFNVH